MKRILNLIDKIEENIILYNLNELKKNISILIDEIISYLPNLDEKKVSQINEIFYYMNNSLDNKDYILYLDILQYELKSFITKN